MPIQISQDIMKRLQKKFPETNVKSFIDNLFHELLDDTFKDGSTTIKGIGKFISFVTYSKRIGSNVVRFKFRPTLTLINKIRQDPYLLNTLPIQSQAIFDSGHAMKCHNSKSSKRKLDNETAIRESSKIGIKKEKEKEVYNHVIELLNS